MSRQIQHRRGTEQEHACFTGAPGEITIDTTNKTLRVHDGETPGGTVLAKKNEIPDITTMDFVIETQSPTADNNYTWYRKYKSGWIEQGGRTPTETNSITVSFPKPMADTNYFTSVTLYRTNPGASGASDNGVTVGSFTTTSMFIVLQAPRQYIWEIKGFTAN